MKAILVIDMPESCDKCRFYNAGNCYAGGKTDWCPIRPMPEKINEDNSCYDSDFYRAEGWNDCIDEITQNF
jgi:hypothetical protein